MAGGSSDAAATLRLASRASGLAIPPELPMQLGADVTVMLYAQRALMTGAGEHVEALRGDTPPLIVIPLDAELGAGQVYKAFDEHDTPRTPEELVDTARRIRAGEPFEYVNDLEPAARRLCPAIDPALEALRAARGGAPDGDRLRPHGLRPQRRPGRGRPIARRGLPSCDSGMKFTWLAAAAVLAGWLIARRHKQKRWLQIAELVAIAAAVLIGVGVIKLPNFEHVLLDVGKALGQWTYVVVGLLAFLETGAFLGFVAPGETAVIVGGLVAGQGQISLLVLIAIVWVCCLLGDLTSYELGKRKGRGWLLKYGERLKVTDERLDQVEKLLDKHGAVMIIVGRFLGFVRPLMPFISGASRMPLRRFLPYDVLAAGVWSITFCTLGFLFWRSIDQLTTYVSRGLFAFGTLIALIAGIVALIHLRRSPEARAKVRDWIDERDDRPGWRILAKLSRPVWHLLLKPAAAVADMTARFSLDRLTPGNLGLELTTLLALALVGGFSFFLLGDVVLQEGEPRIDRWAEDIATQLRNDMLVSIAKVVTHIGSSPVTGTLVVATAIFAAVRHRPIEAVSLIVGWLIVFALVHITKIAYDRARPPAGLVDTFNAAYPSGHSAYAVTLVACATVLVRAGVGWAVRIAAVTVAVILVAVVAVTRVYLRAHFLTDVLGGIALALAVWSIVGVFALFAGRVRHNVPDDRRREDLRHRRSGRRDLADRVAVARRRARLEVLLARARPARGDAAQRVRAGRLRARGGGRRRGCTLVLQRSAVSRLTFSPCPRPPAKRRRCPTSARSVRCRTRWSPASGSRKSSAPPRARSMRRWC